MNKAILPGLFCCPARQSERVIPQGHVVVALHMRVTTCPRGITRLDNKTGSALRVVPEKTPSCVVRRSFGVTKPLFSRLAPRGHVA